jgi:dTDP-4-amino-4,6-dideoxygalactose transaminase
MVETNGISILVTGGTDSFGRKSDHANFPNTKSVYQGCLSLPLFPGTMNLEIERVIDAVQGLVQ